MLVVLVQVLDHLVWQVLVLVMVEVFLLSNMVLMYWLLVVAVVLDKQVMVDMVEEMDLVIQEQVEMVVQIVVEVAAKVVVVVVDHITEILLVLVVLGIMDLIS